MVSLGEVMDEKATLKVLESVGCLLLSTICISLRDISILSAGLFAHPAVNSVNTTNINSILIRKLITLIIGNTSVIK